MAEELWRTLRLRGLAPYAPDFVRCRVLAVTEIPLRADALLREGVPSWAIELASRGPQGTVDARPAREESRRADFPRQPTVGRASMQAAMEAARPENRQRALAALDQDVLASSTVSSNSCRVRLYESVCRTWGVEPWPLSRESIRACGARLKAGAYKSVAVYYSALVSHQLRTMWQAPSPELQRCIQDTRRAVLRGAGPSRLKDHFHVPVLRQVLRWDPEPAPFDGQDPHHMAEVLLLSSWWMLREVGHVTFNDQLGKVTLMLPVQKCDTRGLLCCRTLRCACRAAQQLLCPFHSMRRHMLRLAELGTSATSTRAPLFPNQEGGVRRSLFDALGRPYRPAVSNGVGDRPMRHRGVRGSVLPHPAERVTLDSFLSVSRSFFRLSRQRSRRSFTSSSRTFSFRRAQT